jgi:prepilin-type N-terminal cleavage/methylation domain-containing protein
MSRRAGDAGYSLIEIMVVVCVSAILGSMAMFQIANARPALQGDGAMRVLMSELNYAREVAVSQRREVRVEIMDENRLRVLRVDDLEPEDGTEIPPTLLRDVSFESGATFAMLDGVTRDTPDGFGLEQGAEPATVLRFTSDGMLVNQGGEPINTSMFLLVPGAPKSFRAVTVLGSTARVRGYRWYGANWSGI